MPEYEKIFHELSVEQQAGVAILCALEVYPELSFRYWAEKWIYGEDRTVASSEKAKIEPEKIVNNELEKAFKDENELAKAENRMAYQSDAFYKAENSQITKSAWAAKSAVEAAIYATKTVGGTNKGWINRFRSNALKSCFEAQREVKSLLGKNAFDQKMAQFCVEPINITLASPPPTKEKATPAPIGEQSRVTPTQTEQQTPRSVNVSPKTGSGCLIILLTLAALLTARVAHL